MGNVLTDYYTISGESFASFTEKKSEFIGYISHCENEKDALGFIEKIRVAHRKSAHNVYAYILRDNNISRYSDDGEPQGTAGVPVLETLTKNRLTDICCVVTRYFGGVLLGGGGLVRAYSRAAKIAVDAAKISFMKVGACLEITADYSDYGKIKFFLENFSNDFAANSKTANSLKVIKEDFSDTTKITLAVTYDEKETLVEKLTNLSNGGVKITEKAVCYFDFG